MRKIIMTAALALTTVALAAPAHADDDTNSGTGANAANNWNFSADAVCLQELAVVPIGSDWTGNHHDHCTNGNVIDHSGR